MVYRKAKIPAALRQQVWIHHNGEVFSSKCKVTWCQNTINVFNFQSGHNIPEKHGGKTVVENLIPICAQCNTSMGSNFTIDEFSNLNVKEIKNKEQNQVENKKKYSFGCFSITI